MRSIWHLLKVLLKILGGWGFVPFCIVLLVVDSYLYVISLSINIQLKRLVRKWVFYFILANRVMLEQLTRFRSLIQFRTLDKLLYDTGCQFLFSAKSYWSLLADFKLRVKRNGSFQSVWAKNFTCLLPFFFIVLSLFNLSLSILLHVFVLKCQICFIFRLN
jgi:hypothetical protein